MHDGRACDGVISVPPDVQLFRDPQQCEGINADVSIERPDVAGGPNTYGSMKLLTPSTPIRRWSVRLERLTLTGACGRSARGRVRAHLQYRHSWPLPVESDRRKGFGAVGKCIDSCAATAARSKLVTCTFEGDRP